MKKNNAIWLGVVAVVLALGLSTVACAESPPPEKDETVLSAESQESLAGEWRGEIRVLDEESADVAILNLHEGRIGDPAGKLAWKSNWHCWMELQYGASDTLRIVETNGGDCDDYFDGRLEIMIDGESREMTFRLFDKDNNEKALEGFLTRVE